MKSCVNSTFIGLPLAHLAGTLALLIFALALLSPSLAIAAASQYCPTLNATVAQGRSVQIDVTTCDGTGVDDIGIGWNGIQPPHGTLVIPNPSGAQGTQIITYTHNGDSATSDSFPLEDGAGDTITVNITITPNQPTLSINDVSVSEGNAGTTNATFTVSLSQPAAAGGVSFDIATADGTATNGVDYVASSLTGQTIPAGSSSATFTVLINGDTLSEPNETFFVNISNVTGASVGDSQGQGTIVNDDALPALSIGDVSVNEGNSGTTTATFTVSLSGASGQTVSVNYTTADGTATAGSDYVARSGTLTFAPGVTAQGVAVTVNGDTAVEPNETFSVGLSGASNASIARATGTGTIVNDDVVVTVGPASLPAATAGSAYSQTLRASGGTAPYTFAVTAGALPAGLSLSAAGVLSGTPTASGGFNFTATATDSGGSPTSGARAYTLTVAVATTTFPATSLPAGTAGQAYSTALNPATGGVAPYTYAVTAGALPAGITLNGSSGALTGTPASVGSFSFSVTATDSTTGTPSRATRTYTLTIAAPPIVVAPTALPVATRGTAYSQTLSASGGAAPYTYAIVSGTLPAGITLAPNGTVSGTATVEGSFNFMVTATDAGSFTGNQAYNLTVAGPNLVLPASTLPAGTAGTTYSAAITGATGGTAPYSYALTGGVLPAGTSVNAATGDISGTPTVAGTFNFTLTVSDSTPSPAAQASRSYTLIIAAPGISISPSSLAAAMRSTAYSQTITASGGASPYSYAITGGSLPPGLTLGSGGVLSGTPTADGTFNFTVAATDANSFTGTQAYTLIVAVPELVLPAGSLSAGTAGQAYSASIAPATGGTAPYTYDLASGTLPTGITVDAPTGSLTGTPTNSRTFAFTLRVTDSSSPTKQASRAYTLTIAPPIVAFDFAPAAGTLKDAMAGEEYAQQITVSGGAAPLIYSISTGSLPSGLILNVSTGELTGTIAASADVRSYAFTVQVRDNNGSTGEASYSISVKSRSVDVTDKEVVVPPGGTPNNVDLTRGATGGPFTGANIASVEPSNAGTFSIVRGEFAQASPPTSLGWYLKYVPNPAYSGEVRVGFTLTSALGVSDIATVTYKVGYDAAEVEREISGLVHDFVSRRQDMISYNIYVPDLLDRRQMGQTNEPVSVQMMPSENGMTANFATSLAQMEAARDRADGLESSAGSNLFNIWMDGTFLAHNDKDINGGKWGRFAMLNVGADYLINEKALIGLSFHYDHMTDPTDTDAELIGIGWLAGPYASLEVGRNVFWNASLRYGGSSNDIDTTFWDGTFDTSRWMADTSLEGQWSLQNGATITPKLRAIYFSETIDDYFVKNSAGDKIDIEGFDEEQFRVSLGAEIAKSFDMSDGMKVTPKFGLTGGFSGLDGSGGFAQVATGVALETETFWMFDASLLFNADGEGGKSVGGRLRASKQF